MDRIHSHAVRGIAEVIQTQAESSGRSPHDAGWSWHRVQPKGDVDIVRLTKYEVGKLSRVPLRDLRAFDPGLASSAALLFRERAIVLCFENVRLIVMPNEALVLDSPASPSAAALAGALGARLAAAAEARDSPDAHLGQPPTDQWLSAVADAAAPFELVVMEAALEHVCAGLERAVSGLEADAAPALGEFAKRVSAESLAGVSDVKAHLAELQARVGRVAAELGRALEDPEEALGQYAPLGLGAANGPSRLRSAKRSRTQSATGGGGALGPFGAYVDRLVAELAMERDGSEGRSVAGDEMGRAGREGGGGGAAAVLQAAESTLEGALAQVDALADKLSALEQAAADTEVLVTVKLDMHRNCLLELDIVMSLLMFAAVLFSLGTGIFGMNLDNHSQRVPWAWDVLMSSTAVGPFVLAALVMVFFKRRRVFLRLF